MAILAVIQKSPNSDSIYLPWFTVMDFSEANGLKISEVSFHRAMNELLSKKFLAEAEVPNQYWINPHLFFNGNRMTFISEYRIKSKNDSKAKNKLQSKQPTT